MASQAVLDLIIRLKDQAASGLENLTSSFSSLINPATLVAGGITAIGVAAAGAVNATNDWANKLDSIGDQLGTTADQSAALVVAIQGVGGDSERVGKQLVFMQRGLLDAKGELGPTGKELASLGINMQAFTKLDAATQFEIVAKKLAALPDGLQKTELQTRIFGGSAREMSDTLNAIADGGIEKYTQKAKAMGLAIGDDGVARSIEFNKATADMGMALQGIAITVGNALLPVIVPLLQQFAQLATTVLPQVGTALAGVVQAVSVLAPGIGELVSQVVAFVTSLIAGGDGVTGFGAIFNDVFTAIQEIVTTVMPVIATVVRDVVQGISEFWKENGTEIMAFVKTMWDAIQQIIGLALKIIEAIVVPALRAIAAFISAHGTEIKAIFTTAFNAIKTIVTTVTTVVTSVMRAFLALLKGDTQGAMDAVRGLWEGLRTAITNIANGIASTVSARFNEIKSSIVGAIQGAYNDVLGFVAKFNAFGTNLINGIVAGITGAASALLNALKNAILDAIRAAINIFPAFVQPALRAVFGISGNAVNSVSSVGAGGAPPPAGSDLKGSSAGAGVVINIDARGANMSEAAIKSIVERALREAGYRADARLRMA